MTTTNPLPCGCRASLSRESLMFPGVWHVKQCPLHAAAADLLAACKAMRATMYSPKSEESIMADAAIAKAEPPTTKGSP